MKKILTILIGLAFLATSNVFAQTDNCAGATAVTVGPFGAPAATPQYQTRRIGNTSMTQFPSCDPSGTNYDEWFSFVAPASGVVEIRELNTTGSGDVEIAVWDACGAPNNSQLFCNNSTVTFLHAVGGLTSGTTYYLQVWSDFSNEIGTLELQALQAAANNTCATATVASCSGTVIRENEDQTGLWANAPTNGCPATTGPQGAFTPGDQGFNQGETGLYYEFYADGTPINICNEGFNNMCTQFRVWEWDGDCDNSTWTCLGERDQASTTCFFNDERCFEFNTTFGGRYILFAGNDGAFSFGNPNEMDVRFFGGVTPPPVENDVTCIAELQISLGEDGSHEITCGEIRSDTLQHDSCFVTIVSVDGDTGDDAVGSNTINCSHKGKIVYAMVTVVDSIDICPVGTGKEARFNSCWTRILVEDKIPPRITCPDPLVLDCNEDATPGGDELIVTSVSGVVNGGTTETFNTAVIPQSGCTQVFIKDVDLFFDVDYDFIGDIVHPNGITITSPQGTLFDIYPFPVNTACQTTFGVDAIFHGYDDEATNGAIAFCMDLNSGDDYAPFAGMLSQYDNENPIGTWTWSVENLGTNPTIVNELRLEVLVGCAVESPMVEENCTFELTYQDINDTRNVCGIGQLTRIWTATDCSGLTATCSQSITFENIDPPTITWPADYEVDCFVDVSDLDPDDLNRPFDRPRFQDGDCSQYAVSYVDEYFDVCAPYGYKIRRTWTIIDWCDPNFEESEIQNIKVVDNTAPQISCPADFTVSLRHNDCAAVVSLPSVTATDNCDFNPIVTRELVDASGQVIPTVGVPVGQYRGRYIATDACGNQDTCFFNISVVDPVAPVVVVYRNLVVSLTAGGWAYLCADQLDDGSNDNCTGVGLYIRRDDDASDFNAYYQNLIRQNNCIRYQCRDLGEQTAWLRVYDDADGDGVFGPVDLDGNTQISASEEAANGDNWNEAWVNVEVEDKLPPVLVCPPDIALNCLTDFDDLGITGEPTVDLNCDREDPTYTDVVPHGYCPDSDIIRTWRIEKRLAGHDGVEGTADDIVWVRTCDQVITITDDTPVVIEKLPLDITIDCDGGAVGTDPGDLTKYNYFDDYLNTPQNPGDDSLVVYDFPVFDYDCEHIGINYEDQPFGLCLPGSYKIRRNWTVIDWCEPGFEITYTNVILVDDKEPPVLTVNNPGTVCITNNDPQCRMFADITASAFDLCSNVTITNNSPYGPGTHDASGVYPKGIYTITFTAVDGCGNVATEEITVSVVDCKAPTAICAYGISVGLKQNCEVTLNATDFDAGSSDNCTDQANLTYEVARVDADGNLGTRGSDITFDCDDVGNREVALVVIDDAGNEAVCTTVIQVQVGSCPDTDCGDNNVAPTLNVTGTITKSTGDAVNGVEILVNGQSAGEFNGSMGMLIDGDAQTGMVNAVIEALKEDAIDNGVTTIDLVRIRRAILQLETFDDYQNIAADVNNDEKVSTRDMIDIRRAILKQIDQFDNVPSWRFVPASHGFGATTWATPVPFNYEIETSDSDMDASFVAVKMGDVTGDADVNAGRAAGTFTIEVADAAIEQGSEVTVSLTSAQLSEVLGYQFTLGYDANNVELVSIDGAVEDYNFNLDRASEGVIAVSKVTEEVQGDELFNVTFRALTNTSISEVLTVNNEIAVSEAYDNASSRLDVELNFTDNSGDYALYQNAPNPFADRTTIGYRMAEAGQATITVLDITGKVVYTTTVTADKGNNTVSLTRDQLNSTGIMYYQLEAGEFVATKKMIMIK